jgi:hypothetical protein
VLARVRIKMQWGPSRDCGKPSKWADMSEQNGIIRGNRCVARSFHGLDPEPGADLNSSMPTDRACAHVGAGRNVIGIPDCPYSKVYEAH